MEQNLQFHFGMGQNVLLFPQVFRMVAVSKSLQFSISFQMDWWFPKHKAFVSDMGSSVAHGLPSRVNSGRFQLLEAVRGPSRCQYAIRALGTHTIATMVIIPIGSMVLLYMVLHGSHQYSPFMLAYIPAPWIRHGICSNRVYYTIVWIHKLWFIQFIPMIDIICFLIVILGMGQNLWNYHSFVGELFITIQLHQLCLRVPFGFDSYPYCHVVMVIFPLLESHSGTPPAGRKVSQAAEGRGVARGSVRGGWKEIGYPNHCWVLPLG